MPVTGMYPTVGKGHIEGRPVQILSYKSEDGKHLYLVKYYTLENEVQEWTSWELLPPCMIQDYLSDVKLNPYIKEYSTGKRVQVWWQAEHKSYRGYVQSIQGNWVRMAYEDGDVGEAFIHSDGTLWQAEAFDEEEEKARRLTEAAKSQNVQPESSTRRGRPKGSKDSKPRQFGPRKGRNV